VKKAQLEALIGASLSGTEQPLSGVPAAVGHEHGQH
jgi:hypothetical protein